MWQSVVLIFGCETYSDGKTSVMSYTLHFSPNMRESATESLIHSFKELKMTVFVTVTNSDMFHVMLGKLVTVTNFVVCSHFNFNLPNL